MFVLPKLKIKNTKAVKKIAVLTSGGDAPGMNAAIRAVVRSSLANGLEVFGVTRGYTGLIDGLIHPMSVSSVANIIQRGGTILRTSRSLEFKTKVGRQRASQNLKKHSIDALVVIGGDGSFRGALALHEEQGFSVMGVPGTIDNDIFGTDDTIGFDTAVNTAVDLIDKIRDTASSHDRIFLVEVMGRHSGMIALHTGLGGGAESIIIPEVKTDLHSIIETIERGVRRGKTSSIIVVAEGSQFEGVTTLAKSLKREGFDAKIAILGHTQRGGAPSAHDRVLASTLGAVAVDALLSGLKEGLVGVNQNEVVIRSLKKMKTRQQDGAAKLSGEMLKIAKKLSI